MVSHQIIDGVNGFLVNSIEEAAASVASFLRTLRRLKKWVRLVKSMCVRNFIITRQVRDHLLMYLMLKYIPRKLCSCGALLEASQSSILSHLQRLVITALRHLSSVTPTEVATHSSYAVISYEHSLGLFKSILRIR